VAKAKHLVIWTCISVAIILAVLVVETNVVFESDKEKLFLKSTTSLLPDQNDIGIIWKMEEPHSKTHQEPGFNEGVALTVTKVSVINNTILTLRINKFNSGEFAQNYLHKYILEKKQEGGYNEWTPNISADSCYGRDIQSQELDKVVISCVKDNVYLSAAIFGKDNDMKGITTNFINISLNKMN